MDDHAKYFERHKTSKNAAESHAIEVNSTLRTAKGGGSNGHPDHPCMTAPKNHLYLGEPQFPLPGAICMPVADPP